MNSLEFDPLVFLQEELSSDELHVKVNAIHRLKIVATILGSERVETQLLPYLSSLIDSQEDEILFALAEEIGALHIYLDESPSKLLPLLESLASAEESVVRDQAVASLINLASYLPDYQLIHSFVGTILKLANAEKFTAKMSSCKLFLAAYPRAGGFREKLRNKLVELCQDSNFMIRKSAAEEIGGLINVIEKPIIINDILPIIKILIQDEQEEIRIICINFFKLFCEIFTKEEIKGIILPILSNFQDDKSWKVRHSFAIQFSSIVEKIDKDLFEVCFMQTIITLINDSENDVKTGMLISLSKVIPMISLTKLISQIFPTISSLFQDSSISNKIKNCCIDNLVEIWKVCDKDFCSNSIFPLIESAFPDLVIELKLKMMKNLYVFSNLGNEFVLRKIEPILEESSKDIKNWRIRKLVLKTITKISLNIGISVFKSDLYQYFLNFIKDPVFSIREAVVKELFKLKDLIDSEWFSAVVYPQLQEIYQESQWYLQRVCIIHLLGSVNADYLSIMNSGCKDNVPNVRLAVCKVIQKMIKEGKEVSMYIR